MSASRASCVSAKIEPVTCSAARSVALASSSTDVGLVEQAAADQDLAQVRARERRLRRVAEAFELVAGVRVVGRGIAPPPLGVRLHAEVRLDHGRPAGCADLAVDLERLDLVNRLLGLAEIQVAAVEGGVGSGECATRTERLATLDDLRRNLDRLTRPSLAAGGSAPEREEVVRGPSCLGSRRVSRRSSARPSCLGARC